MANLPHITPNEVALLAAALLVLFVAPALLSWGEARRRRAERAALDAAAFRVTAAPDAGVHVPDMAPLAAPPLAAPPLEAPPPELPEPSAEVASPPEEAVAVPAPAPVSEPVCEPIAERAAETVRSAPAPSPQVELQPLSGTPRHHFRLDDLHQAQLPDWPPAAIRNDPEQSRARQEAERSAELYESRVRAVIIASPYPARSHCLGAADADASALRLSFLLFPVLWPVSQNQAVAQAVFRIDRISGTIHGWVDALRPQELSDENRREIREAGGEA
jgi:hypothetical protein